jgi:Lon-like ATP-dependent protease
MVWSKLTKTKGVVTGLAYTEYGGSVLFLESKKSTVTRDPTSGNLRTTGKLGEVMKESMQIAYTFAKNFLAKKGNHYLEK